MHGAPMNLRYEEVRVGTAAGVEQRALYRRTLHGDRLYVACRPPQAACRMLYALGLLQARVVRWQGTRAWLRCTRTRFGRQRNIGRCSSLHRRCIGSPASPTPLSARDAPAVSALSAGPCSTCST